MSIQRVHDNTMTSATDARGQPIRVLHLVHWLNRGGIERWLLDFFRSTSRDAFVMDVCCKGPSTGILASEFERIGSHIFHCPLGRNHLLFGRHLRQTLQEGEYDILHIQAGIFAGYPAKIGHRAGTRVITTFHSTIFREERTATEPGRGEATKTLKASLRALYGRWSLRAACRYSDAIIACSHAVSQSIFAHARHAPPGLRILPCGTSKVPGRDPKMREHVRNQLGIDENAPVAIHVGTIREAKNHEGLLRIADQIRRSLAHFRLLIVGDGPLRPEVERQIAELRLGGVVQLLGSRDDVEELLQAADLMLFPSRWEGLPVSVIEAQIKGLPIIGSDIGPMREATAPGHTALLFPQQQEEQMARAAVALLSNESRRRNMGDAAIHFAQDHFSMAVIANEHHRLYRELVAHEAIDRCL